MAARYLDRMIAKGPFEITMNAEPPFDEVDGVALARFTFEKRFSGPLDATSTVHMLGAQTKVAGSRAYVAIERITGALEGRRGSFVVVHEGHMDRGASSLRITIVADSGTGELAGITGSMSIEITEGEHAYAIDYALPA